MSLNKFMHPRNRYKISRPDFQALGQKYPEFKLHLVDNAKGKPVLDFQNPEALRVLTICMLKEDYDLKIELPPDRLVPTLPLRLNYVHWIEDIVKDWSKQELNGIDIGTGACCVYPVLAISANPWRFLATETDEVNFSYATKNMEENKLNEKIKVIKVAPNIILEGVIGQTEDAYDFCMCNPPFFADHFEAQGLVSRSPSRPEAKTMSTASPQEGIVQGGEVGFVRRMIEESNFLQNRVRVYTTMLGKKASLGPLKEVLRRYKITNFSTTEFCQGKTMRWGLAWSFDKSVSFPKSLFTEGKKEGKKSVVHVIPTRVGERREQVYDLVIFFKQVLSELKIHFREGKQTQFFALLTLTAAENTWIHSRRKRRQMMREAAAKSAASGDHQLASTAGETPVTAVTSQNTLNEDKVSTDVGLQVCGGVRSENGSAMTGNDGEETGDSVKNEENVEISSNSVKKGGGQLLISSSAVNELCDDGKDPSLSVAKPTDRTDTDRETESECHGTAVLSVESDTNILDQNHRSETAETSDGPPAKRARLEISVPSYVTNADGEENKEKKSERKTVDSAYSSQAKLVKVEDLSTQTSPAVDMAEVEVSQTGSGDPTPSEKEAESSPSQGPSSEGGGEEGRGKDRPPAEYVLKCHMSVRRQGSDLAVELSWLGGQDIQLMHQLIQVFKNRLAQRTSA